MRGKKKRACKNSTLGSFQSSYGAMTGTSQRRGKRKAFGIRTAGIPKKYTAGRASEVLAGKDVEGLGVAFKHNPGGKPHDQSVHGKKRGGARQGASANEKPFDVVGAIMDYEGGDISEERAIQLFQHLVDTGMAWTLQGSYGRTARALLNAGVIKPAGRAK